MESPEQMQRDAEELLIDRLAEEYKILQDKIDKIGAFRFTIKGWSITFIVAALFASAATDSVSPLLLLLCLFTVLALFFFVEKEQTDRSHTFGQRTITIEEVVSRILRKSLRSAGANDFASLRFVPGIAHHLGRGRSRKKERPDNEGSQEEAAPDKRRPKKPERCLWQSLRDADIHFYVIQGVIILAVVLLHSAGEKKHSGDTVVVVNGGETTRTNATPRTEDDSTKSDSGQTKQNDRSNKARSSPPEKGKKQSH